MNLPDIAFDKLKHFFWGAVFSNPGTVAGFFTYSYVGEWAALCPLLTSFAAGAQKEIRDLRGAGTPEWADLIYTTAGGAPSAFALLLGFLTAF